MFLRVLRLVVLAAVCTSAEYLYDDDTVEDVGGRVSRCLRDLPATVLGLPFDPASGTAAAPRGALLLHPGDQVCVRQLMETLWDEGDLDEARNVVASCLFDHYQAAFEAATVAAASPGASTAAAVVLRGLDCAIDALERGLAADDHAS